MANMNMIILYNNIVLLVLINCALVGSLFLIYTFGSKKSTKDLYIYKIKSFTISILYVIIYVLFNFYIVIYMRSTLLYKEIKLKNAVSFLAEFVNLNTLFELAIIVMFLLLLIINIMLVFKAAYHLLLTECKKCFLYYLFDDSVQSDTLYDYINLGTTFGLTSARSPIYHLAKIFNFHDDDWHNLLYYIRYSVYKLPLHFLIVFFIYEIIFNDFTLSITFNTYLFVFLLYSYWNKTSEFLYNTDSTINKKLFNMYYRAYSIKYVNLPLEWENIIYKYVTDGLYRDHHLIVTTFQNEDSFDSNFGLKRENIILMFHTYTTKNGVLYTNKNNDYFEEIPNHDKDVATTTYK